MSAPLFGPALWLCASNFDGAHGSGSEEVIKGNASGRTKDSIGNAVTSAGTIQVEESLGHGAYHFTGEGSITSLAAVSNQFTFVSVFRRNNLSNEKGRFFTGSEGNTLFASHGNGIGVLHLDGWVRSESKSTSEIECYIMTNANGVKNMWDVRENRQILTNSTAGANVWGRTVIGKPITAADQAADVFLYEALVYQSVLNADQINHLKTFFTQKYSISISFPYFFPFASSYTSSALLFRNLASPFF